MLVGIQGFEVKAHEVADEGKIYSNGKGTRRIGKYQLYALAD